MQAKATKEIACANGLNIFPIAIPISAYHVGGVILGFGPAVRQ